MNYLISEVPYFQTPNDIFTCDITNNEKLVYMYLCRCANNGKVAFPSYNTIGKNCSISKSTAIRSVKVLVEKGFVVKEYRIKDHAENYSNIYRVNYDLGSVTMTPGSATDAPGGITNTPNKELHINNYIEKNKLLHHTDSMTSALLISLNEFSLERFGKPIRKHDPDKYYELPIFEDSDNEDWYEMFGKLITKYDYANLDYLQEIQYRLQ